MDEDIIIYVWPDDTWVAKEDVDDIDWYCESMEKSDDYIECPVPNDLDDEDIEELVGLKALPGMAYNKPPTKADIADAGALNLAPGDFLIVKFDEYNENTHLIQSEGKFILSGENVTFEIKKGE